MMLNALFGLADHQKLFETIHLQRRQLHMLIPLTLGGEVKGNGLIPLYSKDKRCKDVLGQDRLLPRFPGENNGGKAYFLAESCLPVLGIEKNTGEGIPFPSKKEKRKNAAKSYLHFWDQIEDAHKATGLETLAALLAFKSDYFWVEEERLRHCLPFIEVRRNNNGELEVGAIIESGGWERLQKLLISFQVDDKIVFDGRDGDTPIVSYWRKTYTKEAFCSDKENHKDGDELRKDMCLVTGKTNEIIARSHKPKILGVPGVSSGGYIVSFAKECPAFSSFGFEMGANAPVSEEAAAKYILGLQALIESQNNSLKVGPLLVCFWAKASPDESGFFARMLRKPDPEEVREFLLNPWKGIDCYAARLDRFYSVTLRGNAGRIVVRHWMQSTVETARKNFACWFKDLDIVEMTLPDSDGNKRKRSSEQPKVDSVKDEEKMPPRAIFRLACTTVREAKDLQSEVSSQLYRAALEGTAPSIMLVKPILQRLKADLHRYGIKTLFNNVSRFALLKLILNRNRKEGEIMVECKVFETDDPAYNCGRLLAVLAEIQAKAFDYKLSGPGVAERYFGTASVSPSSVFPLLLRLNRHHLEKIRKTSGGTWNQENNIQEVICRLAPNGSGAAPQFPRHLDLQAQGRFAIGFYQQKADVEMRKEAARKNKQNAASEAGHDQG
jgi:CRISPR-associated protein Csd1